MRATGRLVVAICIGTLAVAAWAQTARGATGDRFAAALAEFEAFWPGVEGYVVSVTGETVFTDVPAAAGLRPGSELIVFREGGNIVHPLTKQVLGRYEEPVGALRVTQVRGGYTVGDAVSPAAGGEVKAGDRVRITSTKVRLLVLPAGGASAGEPPDWENELFFALERSTRFQPQELRDPAPANEPAALSELARRQGADALLLIETLGSGTETFVALSLHSGTTGLLQATIRVPVGRPFTAYAPVVAAKPAAVSPATSRGAAAGESEWSVFELDRRIVGLTMGNLTGAGGGEVAVTDGQALRIFAPDGASWRLIWEDEGKALYRVLAVDSADIDGNGLDELFVTRIAIGRLDSLVLEHQGGGFPVREDGKNLFFRVIRPSRGNPRLFAQEFDPDEPAGRPVREYVWEEGTYSPRGGRLPGVGSIYGFGLADVDGDGSPETARLNDGDQLQVFTAEGKLLWGSEERFGGSANFIDRDTLGQSLPEKEVGGFLIKGRLLGLDLDGDGRDEILASRNVPKAGFLLSGVRVFDRSNLAVLRWDGLAMREALPLDDLPGYLADFAAAPVAGGALAVVGLSRGEGVFSRGSGRLLSRTLSLTGGP